MNKQEVFNTVSEHLIKQGVAATIGLKCSYRTPAGLKCAIGCLIKDEFYTPALENHTILDITVQNALCNSLGITGLVPTDVGFLSALQDTHDSSCPSDWKLDLANIAHKHKLTLPAVLL